MNGMIDMLTDTANLVLQRLQEKGSHLLGKAAINSPRAVGDTVQTFLSSDEGLQACLPTGVLDKFESGFERRSMEDMAFFAKGLYFAVDCKTHNLETAFNMPNLISVQRLAKFYENDTNVFCILIVEYTTDGGQINYKRCVFRPIESFAWDCLTFGALGWGQIQIANSNNLKFTEHIDRRAWMLELCDRIDEFYCEEIEKIGTRRQWFDKVRYRWEQREETIIY